MDNNKINQMLLAANGSNHVGEYPSGSYSPMPNRVGSVHAVSDLQEILKLKAQVEQLQQELSAEQEMVSNYHDTNSALAAQVEQLQRTTFEVVCASAILGVPIHEEESHKCLAARDAEVKALAFEQAGIPKKAKAGCIGEFKFTIEGARCCPECYNNGPANDCEMCGGESGENGVSDLTVSVPWDLCKEIWLTMNQFAANELRQQAKAGA
ncbi:hypothetical protein AAY72_01705 [Alishewanella sp. WH16-1]|uniref:hypothetical protein n=1 Tax=Alishewanella sp. WH16-1 TaxID=1651088 RepID=UPI00070FEA6D|nr:hypothetical protein [Alishewanella sp. WH16-1]KRS22850.1 hypothetical protein AAY72_01705 [Alishewanella sp. WH16-1]